MSSTKISLPIANPEYGSVAPAAAAPAPKTRSEGGDVMSEIKREITENSVFLYMKGTPQSPACGFSMRVVQILDHLEVKFAACNILEDMEKREAIKVFANWPTIPQLYIKGTFVGGCDIVKEMHQDGSFEELLIREEIIKK